MFEGNYQVDGIPLVIPGCYEADSQGGGRPAVQFWKLGIFQIKEDEAEEYSDAWLTNDNLIHHSSESWGQYVIEDWNEESTLELDLIEYDTARFWRHP